MSQPLVIVGRILENYRREGEPVPADSVILECFMCHAKVAVSPAGYARWQSRITPATPFSGALCNFCTFVVAARQEVELDVSAQAAAQAAGSAEAKRSLELIQWAASLPKEPR